MEVTGPVPTVSWEKMSPPLNNATFMCSNLQGVFAHRSLESVLGLGAVTASGRILQIVAPTLGQFISHQPAQKPQNSPELDDLVLMI